MSTILSLISTTYCVKDVLKYVLDHDLEPCKVDQASHVVTISDIYLEPHLSIEKKTVETGEMGFFKGNVMKKVIQGYRAKTTEPAFFYQFSGEVRHLTSLNFELTEGKERVVVQPERGTDVFVPYSELNPAMLRMQVLRSGEWALSIDDNANSLYKTPEGLFFYSDNHDQYPVFSKWEMMGALYCNRKFTKYGDADTKSDKNRVKYARLAYVKGSKLDLDRVPVRYLGACRRAKERFESYKTEENLHILQCLEEEIINNIMNQCKEKLVKYWDSIKCKIRAAMVLCWLIRGRAPTDLERVLFVLGTRYMCQQGLMRETIRGFKKKPGCNNKRFALIQREVKRTAVYNRVKKRKNECIKSFLPLDFCDFLSKKEVKVLVHCKYLECAQRPPIGITPRRLVLGFQNYIWESMYKELDRDMDFYLRIEYHKEKLQKDQEYSRGLGEMRKKERDRRLDYEVDRFLREVQIEEREKMWAEKFAKRSIAPKTDEGPPVPLNTNAATQNLFKSMKFKKKTRVKKTKN